MQGFGINKDKAIFTYALQCFFCSSIAITLGFEYGFTKKIDVVTTNPMDYEEANYDISKEISKINDLKKTYLILKEDNFIEQIQLGENIFAFKKKSKDNKKTMLVIANLSEYSWTRVEYINFYQLFGTDKLKDISIGHQMEFVPNYFEYYLKPYEIKLFYTN